MPSIVGLDPGRRSQTFKAVALILTRHPVLAGRGVVKTWLLPWAHPALGVEVDPTQYLAEITAQMCPVIRLYHKAGPVGPGSPVAINVSGKVWIEMATAGVDDTPLLDLWDVTEEGLMVDAVAPDGDDVADFLWDRSVADPDRPGATVSGFGPFQFGVEGADVPVGTPDQRRATPGLTRGLGVFGYTVFKNP